MKDGRVKLKLTLMGIVVDKCGICLTQFKDAEVACLGTHCQHAYVLRTLFFSEVNANIAPSVGSMSIV
jgi:hypothetical protein